MILVRILYFISLYKLDYATFNSLKMMTRGCNGSMWMDIDRPGLCLLMGNIKNNLHGVATAKNVSRSIFTAETLARNPCLLIKIASYFDESNVRLIVSKELTGQIDKPNVCKRLDGRLMQNSVVYVEGDDTNLDNLKMQAKGFLSREFRTFVVICSKICTSFILQIAEKIGFGVSVYRWIIITSLPLRYEAYYPENVLSLVEI